MTLVSSFVLSFGAWLALIAAVAAWLFRTAAAPFALKLVLPVAIVFLACVTPYEVDALLGFPMAVSLADLPARAELVAFVPHDTTKTVDLWLRQGDGAPRAYELTLDDRLKETLRQARQRMGQGARVMLAKRGQADRRRPGLTDQLSRDGAYAIDDSAFALPNK
jgi:hypothetical protein